MSEIIQAGFGAILRRRREELKLSLDDVAASTRIRKTYLHALEEENLPALPGTAYSIGFLRIYARHLGLPVESLLSSLAANERDNDRGASTAVGNDHQQSSPKDRPKGRGGRLLLLLLLLGMIAAAYYFLRPGLPVAPKSPIALAPLENKPVPAVSPQPQVVPPVAVQAPPQEQAVGSEQPAIPVTELPVLPAEGAVVRMLPVSSGVMKVSLDNQEIREYQLQPDQSLNWKVTKSLSCELSTPGLVRVWVDQQEIALSEYPAFILKAGSQQSQRQ
jgi:transcriptional regulator with XRE-family HTH domain